MSLEPITPKIAVEEYLDEKQADGASESTVRSHRSRLGHFVEWCQLNGIGSVSELSTTDIREYKSWRREKNEIKKVTLKTQMDTLRVFLTWCEDYGHVPTDFSKSARSPSLSKGDNVRDASISTDACLEIRDRLRKYHYATRQHVVFELIWHGTIRRGGVHSLDVDDFDPKENTLRFRHRPENGTVLKNKKRSERVINISDDVTEIITDWVDDQRPRVTDDYGRKPLIATKHGRAHLTTISSDIYNVTRPAFRREECCCSPDCNIGCANEAYRCEDSHSPHTIRSASITYHLNRGWLIDMVADRADNTAEVIKKHYDVADEDEKAERRREFVELLGSDEEEEEGSGVEA